MAERFAGVQRVLREACGHRFTGAVARIECGGELAFEAAYGTTRTHEPGRAVYVDTRFDLASITKLFVATLALQLVAAGGLELDGSLERIFPEWIGTPHAQITLRMLLAHTSGMNSGADYRTILGENVERFALTRPLAGTPNDGVIYSDLGFITLGAAIERASGRSLSAIAAEAFARPTLAYSPRGTARVEIPATEDDGWRGRVQGYVHDEKAYLMGGVAGHAGLFGTAARRCVARPNSTSPRQTAAAVAAAGEARARSAYRTSLRSGAATRPRLGVEDERRQLVRTTASGRRVSDTPDSSGRASGPIPSAT